MDKNTLSHYGWMVVVIIILAIMLSLATPFASVIRGNIEGAVERFTTTTNESLDKIILDDDGLGDEAPDDEGSGGTEVTLSKPTLSLNGDKLVIECASSEAEGYEIYIDDTLTATITSSGKNTEYDLSSLSVGTHTIGVVAKADGKENSDKATISFTRVEDGPVFTVTTYSGFATDRTLVLVTGDNANGYNYNGNKMFKVEAYGNAFAYVASGSVTKDDASALVTLSDDANTVVVPVGYDVNGHVNTNGKVDFYDVSAANSCKNGGYELDDPMWIEMYLRADVNGDKAINQTDIDLINANYTKDEPVFTVTTYTEYVPGYTLILVDGDAANGYNYNGNKMYKVERYGAYGYVASGSITSDTAKTLVSVSTDSNITVITDDCDINNNGSLAFADAMVVTGCYKLEYDVATEMHFYLKSDVNKDYVVDETDYDVVVDAVMEAMYEDEPVFTVTTYTEYVPGYTLILVDGDAANGYNYNGNKMYKVERYDAYGYVASGSISSDTAKTLVSVSADSNITVVDDDYDINNNGELAFADAAVADYCSKLQYDVVEKMHFYLQSDVNKDYVVNQTDYDVIVDAVWAAIDKEEGQYEDEPVFTVTTYPGYVPVGTKATEGGTLVLVNGDAANGYEYNGKKMYWDEQHGGVYSWIVDGSVSAEDVKSFITVSEDSTAPIVIPVGYNINGYTTNNDVVDFADMTAAHACSQGRYVITDFMQGYLRADVNNDKVINSDDTTAIENCPEYE